MTNLSDQEIVEKLIERDPMVTRWFFYVKCRPLFLKLMKKFYIRPVEYDEIVNEAVVLLMERDSYRLRQFNYESSLCHWLRTCLIHHFIRHKDKVIEDESKEPLYPCDVEANDAHSQTNKKIDMSTYLTELAKKNKRHAYVLRRLFLEDADFDEVAAEIHVKVSNMYNIKKRAIEKLTEIALNLE